MADDVILDEPQLVLIDGVESIILRWYRGDRTVTHHMLQAAIAASPHVWAQRVLHAE